MKTRKARATCVWACVCVPRVEDARVTGVWACVCVPRVEDARVTRVWACVCVPRVEDARVTGVWACVCVSRVWKDLSEQDRHLPLLFGEDKQRPWYNKSAVLTPDAALLRCDL